MNFGNLFKNFKIQLVLLAVLLSLAALFLRDANPYTMDAKLGIEFVGGVRIPVSLERSVDPATMDSVVETLKNRVNTFGLSQAVVRAVGDRDVLVEIPQADESVIASVKRILQEQGRFEAIIDGKQAVIGEDVIGVGGPNGELTPATLQQPQWQLSFTVTKAGAQRFSQAALGKANFPVYMFLDRPQNGIVIMQRSELSSVSEKDARDALKKDGDDIFLLFSDEISNQTGGSNSSEVILTRETALLPAVAAFLSQGGFSEEQNATKRIIYRTSDQITPRSFGTSGVSEWPAIGLISGPVLAESLANGFESQFYSVTGAALGATPQEQEAYAISQIKQLKSVISGGKLPVSALVGSSFSIQPSLGAQFLQYSVLATIFGIIVVALLIVLRYGNPLLSIPIIITNIFEIVILAGVIGSIGTLDLAAMAGVIALIGTGVDDQLIITDEMLRKRQRGESVKLERHETREKIAAAFRIIFTTAGVAIAAMLPLILSGVVEIAGFGLSTIIGVLIGIFITRPAFGVFIEEMFKKQD